MNTSPVQNEVLLKRLQSLDILRGVEPEMLAAIAERSTWKVYQPDAVVFWEGAVEANLYYLQYGWLKVIKYGVDGREQILRFLGPGEIFNEVGVFARRPSPATAMTLEEAGIWLIPRAGLEQIVASYPQVALRLLENMAERFISLVDLTADLSLRTVEARLAKLLLEQAEGDAIPRRRWTTQNELAARLGTVPDVLSRALRELTRAGLIETDRQQIRILDRPGLAKRGMLQNS